MQMGLLRDSNWSHWTEATMMKMSVGKVRFHRKLKQKWLKNLNEAVGCAARRTIESLLTSSSSSFQAFKFKPEFIETVTCVAVPTSIFIFQVDVTKFFSLPLIASHHRCCTAPENECESKNLLCCFIFPCNFLTQLAACYQLHVIVHVVLGGPGFATTLFSNIQSALKVHGFDVHRPENYTLVASPNDATVLGLTKLSVGTRRSRKVRFFFSLIILKRLADVDDMKTTICF